MSPQFTAFTAALLFAALGVAPASASTDDPTSPFYVLPTKAQGTTLQAPGSRDLGAPRQ